MIVLTQEGVLTVWDGARLIYERQMTVHEIAAHQVAVALALRQAVAWPNRALPAPPVDGDGQH